MVKKQILLIFALCAPVVTVCAPQEEKKNKKKYLRPILEGISLSLVENILKYKQKKRILYPENINCTNTQVYLENAREMIRKKRREKLFDVASQLCNTNTSMLTIAVISPILEPLLNFKKISLLSMALRTLTWTTTNYVFNGIHLLNYLWF